MTALVASASQGMYYATGAAWLAYAPWDQSFYVASSPSSVDRVAASNGTLLSVIPVGSQPFGVAVDPNSKEVFVTNAASGNVTVINGTTQASVASISVQSGPLGIAFDSSNGTLFVADNATANVSVIQASTLTLVTNVSVGGSPAGVAWDNASDQVFVSDRGSNEVSVISGTTNRVVATVAVGSQPFGVADDNLTGNVYVANEGSNNVSVISATSDSVVASVPIAADGYTPDLQGVAYDSAHRVVWVTAGFAAIAINTTLQRAVYETTFDPAGIAFDPANGDICVTNTANTTFGCFLFGSAALTPMSNITFKETGLPVGTEWGVTLTGRGSVTQASTSASIVFGVDSFQFSSYNYSYSVGQSSGYAPNQTTGYATSPNRSDSVIAVTFHSSGLFPVTFRSSGLSFGTVWWVDLRGTNTTTNGSSIQFWEPNGSYAYAVGGGSGWTPSPTNGSVLVNGGPVSVSITWTSSGSGGGGSHYWVAFVESGLPNGSLWAASLSNASGSITGEAPAGFPINVSVQNGSYHYVVLGPTGWGPSPSSGNLSVHGASWSLSFAFGPVPRYSVVFTESGLPNGTDWTVGIGSALVPSFDAQYNNSVSSAIGFQRSNGSFAFAVGPANSSGSWRASPANGTFVVHGSAVSISIHWTQVVNYALTFIESGLPNGTLWNVTLSTVVSGHATLSSSTASITFSVPNGTYAFVVPSIYAYGVPEYTAISAAGNVTIAGTALTVSIAFSAAQGFYAVTFQESGLAPGTSWSVAMPGVGLHSATSTIVVAEPNGTYNYSVGGAVGYTAIPSTGSVTVQGAAVNLTISFALASGYYAVTFVENGLGPSTLWSVGLGHATSSSTGASISFAEPNGSYGFHVGRLSGYLASPSNGTVWVNGSTPQFISIQFNSTDRYSVLFHESGLPNGTGWAVSIGSQLVSSLTSNVTLLEPNGTFGYLVLQVSGFTTSSSGFVTVNGSAQTVSIAFLPETYPVIVIEFGLPNGTTWSVTVVNTTLGINRTYSTSGNALIFYLPNGTYTISVNAGGYSANLSSSQFTVAGGLLGGSPTVRFTAGPGTSGVSLVLPWLAPWEWAGLGLLAFGVLLGGAVAYRQSRARREGAEWIRELTEGPESVGGRPKN